MFCNKCGNEIKNTEGVKFCNKCGNDLSASIEAMKVTQAPVTPVVEQVVKEPPKVDLEKRAKNKRNLWIVATVCCVGWVLLLGGILISIVLLFGALFNNVAQIPERPSGYESFYDDEEEIDEVDKEDEVAEEEETEEVTEAVEGKVVGSDEYGYITIPENWAKFVDVDGNDTLQYSYANVYIATLYAVDTTVVDAETYASNVMTNIKNDGATQVKGAEINVAGYDGYQVYGYYEDINVWLVMWFFETEDGKTRYIAIEGPDPESEYFNIPNTFSVTND